VHHRHTSYGALALLLILLVSVLIFASRGVALAAPEDPVTHTQSVHAVVPAQAPTTAPQINTIQSGTVFNTGDPITVGGTCPDDTLIKIFKNEVFGGAAFCDSSSFSLLVDLFIGSNTLISRPYNANNIPGPDSDPIVVIRTLTADGQIITQAANQFFITSDIYNKGVNLGEKLTWPITLSGGQAPYAVSIGWGDGKTDLISRKEAGTFEISHRYAIPGEGTKPHHAITITATDQLGNQSFIQLVTVVNGDPKSLISTTKQGYDLSGAIRIAWQAVVTLALVILSFWLGERREAYILNRAAHKA
jgi:hypothetical protein